MTRGKLIVFEGVSGTGKETQAKLVKEYLRSKGISSRIVFHPSAHIKPVLKAQKTKTDQINVLVADRESKVKTVIIPSLLRGTWILSLRNYVSAMVYQGDKGAVKSVDIEPDTLFFFDTKAKISMQRIISRGEERGLYEKIKLLEQKRSKYKKVLRNIAHVTIDAGRTIDEVHADVVKYIV